VEPRSSSRNPRFFYRKSRDNSVGITTDYGLDDRDSNPGGGWEFFSLRHRVQTGSGPTQPHIQWVLGALSLGVKRTGPEADHSPSPSAEVKECTAIYLYLYLIEPEGSSPSLDPVLSQFNLIGHTFTLYVTNIHCITISHLPSRLCSCLFLRSSVTGVLHAGKEWNFGGRRTEGEWGKMKEKRACLREGTK
jgi:hypothetical protein